MPKKILYIKPTSYSTMNQETKEYLEKYKDDNTIVDVVNVSKGPKHLEALYYEALASTEILRLVKEGENQGYDAAIIGCFYDPVLYAAREICEHMVVTAPEESSLHLAASLGNTFSIIVGRNKWILTMRDNVDKYGFTKKLASFRSLDMGVLQFHAAPGTTEKRMRQEIALAIEKDRAEIIILGCTMQFGFFAQLQKEFSVPVIDSMLAALKYAELLVEVREKMNWYTSKIGSFTLPDRGEIKEWHIEEDYHLEGLWNERKDQE
ncbi:aspartate/glutamate racemase family protein [Candidatus Formimonas warabiya]|uniref:Hydantoin racemase n=1 Tax=Formimonas warabiya TaxID=1761012 RepID=A0A3G1KSD3_FORW1|nr:aspartate/glutamate racemase family protein [Candidatus Formimonas warabiya]ATW25340.1 hydantoin racemase [Candidatus Formimonas warabiya]